MCKVLHISFGYIILKMLTFTSKFLQSLLLSIQLEFGSEFTLKLLLRSPIKIRSPRYIFPVLDFVLSSCHFS